MSYSCVDTVPAKEFVYATALMLALLPAGALIVPSVIVSPVSTLIRRSCPVLLTTRSRSAAGLKSTPKCSPDKPVNGKSSPAAARSLALTVATPVDGTMV